MQLHAQQHPHHLPGVWWQILKFSFFDNVVIKPSLLMARHVLLSCDLWLLLGGLLSTQEAKVLIKCQ